MTDAPTASVHDYDREIAHYRRLIQESESIEIEEKERRSYSSEAGYALLWMMTIPGTIAFIAACVWAIATDG